MIARFAAKLLKAAGRREQAQSLTEFALVMPLLIGMLVVIMLLSLVGFSLVSITSATRMGARHMMTYYDYPQDPGQFETVDEEITWLVTSSMPFLNWHNATVTIWPEIEDRDPPCEVGVHVIYNTNLPTVRVPMIVRPGSFFLLPPIILQAESKMQLE